jgi:hypothetical protein
VNSSHSLAHRFTLVLMGLVLSMCISRSDTKWKLGSLWLTRADEEEATECYYTHSPWVGVNGRAKLNYPLQNRQQNLGKMVGNSFQITNKQVDGCYLPYWKPRIWPTGTDCSIDQASILFSNLTSFPIESRLLVLPGLSTDHILWHHLQLFPFF